MLLKKRNKMANKVIEVIKNRVSCRDYSNKRVSLKKLEMILEAGKSAPSACNRQIADITAVRKSLYINKIRDLSKHLMNRDVMYGASTIVLVHAPKDDPFCAQDCSCIIENMMVAATALKIDSCWINQFDELLGASEAKKLRKSLGIPEDHRVVGSVALGYRKDGLKIEVKDKKNVNIIVK